MRSTLMVYPVEFSLHEPERKNDPGSVNSCPQNIPFAAAIQSTLELLGEECPNRLVGDPSAPWMLSLRYLGAMGASGAIFDLPFGQGMPDPRAAELVFLEAGYHARWIPAGVDLRLEVCAALYNKRPVILIGENMGCESILVTGYEDYGAVLLARQTSGSHREDSEGGGQKYIRQWEHRFRGVLAVGNKHKPLLPRSIYMSVLQSGSRVLERGKQTYVRWLQNALSNNPVDQDGLESTFEYSKAIFGTIAEVRWYGAHYLNDIADYLPEADAHLYAASICCEQEHELMWQIEGLVRKQAPRSEIGAHLRQAAGAYCGIAAHVEQACDLLGKESSIPMDHSSQGVLHPSRFED
jgi:hypothetical protein